MHLAFKKKYTDSNDINRAYNCNCILFKLVYNMFSERKFMTLDGVFKILKIIGLVDVPPTEIVYHWAASLRLTEDDYICNRYEKCDLKEFVETFIRI